MSKAITCAIIAILVVIITVFFLAELRPSSEHLSAGKKTLYDNLGGVFPIAAVVNHFSDAILQSPVVGVNSPNPQLREWSQRQSAARLPGLKFQRALWVADAAGGPFRYQGTKPGPTRLNLENAHRHLRITPDEFDEVARLLGASLDHYQVPPLEKRQVLGAFLAHKGEVTAGSRA